MGPRVASVVPEPRGGREPFSPRYIGIGPPRNEGFLGCLLRVFSAMIGTPIRNPGPTLGYPAFDKVLPFANRKPLCSFESRQNGHLINVHNSAEYVQVGSAAVLIRYQIQRCPYNFSGISITANSSAMSDPL